MLRRRERQLQDAKMEAQDLRRSLAQRNAQLEELQEQIKMLREKNDAKQEVRSDSNPMQITQRTSGTVAWSNLSWTLRPW